MGVSGIWKEFQTLKAELTVFGSEKLRVIFTSSFQHPIRLGLSSLSSPLKSNVNQISNNSISINGGSVIMAHRMVQNIMGPRTALMNPHLQAAFSTIQRRHSYSTATSPTTTVTTKANSATLDTLLNGQATVVAAASRPFPGNDNNKWNHFGMESTSSHFMNFSFLSAVGGNYFTTLAPAGVSFASQLACSPSASLYEQPAGSVPIKHLQPASSSSSSISSVNINNRSTTASLDNRYRNGNGSGDSKRNYTALSTNQILLPPEGTFMRNLRKISHLSIWRKWLDWFANGILALFIFVFNLFLLCHRTIHLVLLFVPPLLIFPFVLLFRQYRPIWMRYLIFCMEASGPTFIKWGQWASTRPDIFPEDMLLETHHLLDNTSAHSFEKTKRIIESAFNAKFEDIFDRFDQEPLGSGCVAQVHRARLKDFATDCAVKIIHPGVRETVERDLFIMNLVAKTLDRFIPPLRFFGLTRAAEKFAEVMSQQLDMRTEAHNLEVFNIHFTDRHSHGIIFPKPIPGYATENVLIETYEEGITFREYIE